MNRYRAAFLVVVFAVASFVRAEDAPIVFADFEGDDYGAWKVAGTAFGKGPAKGTLANQMHVSGFQGKGLVNSFNGGDASTGRLTSPEFTVSRKYVSFLVGGGGHAGKTCVNLLVGGKVVRTATGPNTNPGGSEELRPTGWDVAEFAGKKATIEIVDEATGGWGHINVDHIVFTNMKPPMPQINPSRELTAEKRYLHLPVKNGSAMRKVSVSVGGEVVRRFDIELADGEPDWWAFLDVREWKGKKLTVAVDRLPSESRGLSAIEQGDSLKGAEKLYKEALRPQLHFSSRRGWLNDPNGLVFHDGTWHMFYQHNPYGTRWGNMHWGHAVSRDLVTWEERDIALYPDQLGTMFSGSAVVDWKNTSGLGKEGKPPLILAYTAAGPAMVQCLAGSSDGGQTFTKYAKNPVVKTIGQGDRDPKVIWHAPTKRWVMVLYVGVAPRGKGVVHTVQFLTSPDLKAWTYRSKVEGLFECPDLFPLPLDGDAKKQKWVLTAASSEYLVGEFDGEKFTPETKKLPGHRGRGFYAAQTFSDVPAKDGRRIQIGWGQMPSPKMSFDQMMCFPCELSLHTTADGPRMAWRPVKELESLREKSHHLGAVALEQGSANPLAKVKAELAELRLEAALGEGAELLLKVRGTPVRYDAKKQELNVAGHKAPAPLRGGKLKLIVLADRTSLTIWAGDGLTYVPFPVVPKDADRSLELSVTKRTAKVTALDVHELRSIWSKQAK